AQVNETGEIDLTAPVLTINPIGATNDETPVISGETNAPEGSVISINLVDAQGTTQNLQAQVLADGSWQVEAGEPVAQGRFTVSAQTQDAVGNVSNASITAIFSTEELPEISLNPIGLVNDVTPIISGTSSAQVGSEIRVIVEDSNGAQQLFITNVNADSSWSIEIENPLAEGIFSIDASVFDETGNTANINGMGEIDITAPSLTVNEIGESSNNQPEISGFTDAQVGSAVEIVVTDSSGVAQNLTALVTGDGSWSVQIPDALPEGEADIS
ncbi:Ig-like domain-containing protein, partial [Catenovulum sp. 2E275]|uniref:Ig-like domain-containing protein n=1 Tax=Catenovulum sp. 2E275 TaxID=2980497 RepID=UPI0021CE6933